MKVLFVSSGKKKGEISPIIANQGKSLEREGVILQYFTVHGKGLQSYIKSINSLKEKVNNFKPDIIHAHYSFCGILTSIASPNSKIIVSLMGSDAYKQGLWKTGIQLFHHLHWKATIVKSKEMKEILRIKNLAVIPNGVDLNEVRPMNMTESRKYLQWSVNGTLLLFGSDPSRPEKNFSLFRKAFDIVRHKYPDTYWKPLINFQHSDAVKAINAATIVVLSSIREGSPNVIKESMACSKPIVCTKVGDVEYIIGSTEGCEIVSSDPLVMAQAIISILENRIKETAGRDRIEKLLSSRAVAQRIIKIYENT